MLVYDKIKVEPRLYGNYSGNVPTADDPHLTYTDEEGTEYVDIDIRTKLVDNGSAGGVQRLKKASNGDIVNVFIGEHQIIGDPIQPGPTPVQLESIEVVHFPNQRSFGPVETVSYAGLVVRFNFTDETYIDCNWEDRPYTLTASPEEGVPMNEWIVSQPSGIKSGMVTLAITAHGVTFTDQFSIRVDDGTSTVDIESVTWGEGKGTFTVGDEFSSEGMDILVQGGGFHLHYTITHPYDSEHPEKSQGFWTVPANGDTLETAGTLTGQLKYQTMEQATTNFTYTVTE